MFTVNSTLNGTLSTTVIITYQFLNAVGARVKILHETVEGRYPTVELARRAYM